MSSPWTTTSHVRCRPCKPEPERRRNVVPERGSTQHSARVDEELHKETESLLRGSPVEARAEDWRRMEPPADGEPLPDSRVTIDDVELRSLLATSLRPSAFPGDRAR